LENGSLYILIGIGVALVILNSIASYVILHTHFEVKERRTYQLIFVWVLPFLGAIFAILINREVVFSILINREDYFADRRLNKVGNNSNITTRIHTISAIPRILKKWLQLVCELINHNPGNCYETLPTFES
jgi:hypothetical protein